MTGRPDDRQPPANLPPIRSRGEACIVPRPRPARAASPGLRATLVCLVLLIGLGPGLGCSTRTSRDRIINRYGLDVYLLSERKTFGSAVERGYAHPSEIDQQRLEIILGSLQIEQRVRARTVIRPAIPAEILNDVANGLAEAFRRAESTDMIALSAQRKQRQKGIFHRMFLTSLIAFMEGDELVLHISRVDWPFEQDPRETRLPMPQVDDPQQKFRVQTNEYVRRAGKTGVAIDWRSDVFSSFASAAAVRSAPADASAGGTTVLAVEPVEEELPEPEPLTNEQLQSLTSEDLRTLADLEDARSAGTLTEQEFRRQRQAVIDAAVAETP